MKLTIFKLLNNCIAFLIFLLLFNNCKNKNPNKIDNTVNSILSEETKLSKTNEFQVIDSISKTIYFIRDNELFKKSEFSIDTVYFPTKKRNKIMSLYFSNNLLFINLQFDILVYDTNLKFLTSALQILNERKPFCFNEGIMINKVKYYENFFTIHLLDDELNPNIKLINFRYKKNSIELLTKLEKCD